LEDGNVNCTTPAKTGTENTGWDATASVWTFEVIDPAQPIKFKNKSAVTGNQLPIEAIYIEWEPAKEAPAPEMPEVSLRKDHEYYTYNWVDENTIEASLAPGNFSSGNIVYAKQILVERAPKYSESVYYSFNDEPTKPNTTADLTTENGWTKFTGLGDNNSSGLPLASIWPAGPKVEPTDKKITFIAAHEGTKMVSDIKTITLRIKPISAPKVDIEKTKAANPEGTITFDEEKNTIYYTCNNPIICLDLEKSWTLPTGAAINGISYFYTTDGTDPKYTTSGTVNADTKTTTKKYDVGNTIQIQDYFEGGLEPAPGTYHQIKAVAAFKGTNVNYWEKSNVLYYDENNLDPTIIHIVRGGASGATKTFAAPTVTLNGNTTNLAGNVKGYLKTPTFNATITTVEGIKEEEHGEIQYQLLDFDTNETSEWTKFTEGGSIIPEKFNGRVVFREYKEDYDYIPVQFDLNYISTYPIDNLKYDYLLGLDDAATAITMTEPVRVIGSFKLIDDNENPNDNVYLLFVADKDGNVLRAHVESNNGNPFESAYNNYQLIDGLTGVLRKNKEMPELYVNSPSLDYSAFISAPYDAPETFATYVPDFVQRVPVISDYSKLMYFGPLRWDAEAKTLTDNEDNSVKLYQRIETGKTVEAFENELEDGEQYRIAGYVGYADGAPVILPRAYVGAPLLRAPNPINPDAAPGELIEMNVISSELELTAKNTGVSEGTVLEYFLCDDTEAVGENDTRWKDAESIDPNKNESVTITSDDLADGGCTIAARMMNGTMPSGVVTVRFNKIADEKITKVESIAEFKTEANKIDNLPALNDAIDDKTHSFFQYTGYARVREITPNYIYIRTTDKDGNLLDDVDTNDAVDLTDEAKQNRSDNSILIYNEDGWEFDVVSVDTEGNPIVGSRTALQVGDIITNFALIPTQSGFGNLVANATDFTRTFRRLDGVTVESGTVKPIELNAQDNSVYRFSEEDRMLRYSIKNVTVSRSEIATLAAPGDVAGSSTSYLYTLNIPGSPVLNNGDVFDANPDWDVMWSESALFNLEGVVMLADGDKAEDEDGRYMLAVKPESIEFSNVETPRAPRITLTGTGAKDGNFLTEATVTLESSTAATSEAADIYYTTDGTDPRLSSASRKKYTAPFTIKANTVIKAYVRSNGTPNSEVADTLFTRTAVDTRYIVNFVNGAVEGTPYHITATAKVVATGGEYAFVRGTQGHYLPIHFEDKTKIPAKGQYINDFVAEPHMVGNIVRGAHVHGDYIDLFKGSIAKPSNIDEITAEPDVVDNITAANARRYVKILGVKLVGENFNSEGDDLATHDTQWKLTTKKGEGDDIRVDHNILEPQFDWNEGDKTKAAYYNVTGFAMIGDDGEIELWPTEVEKVKTSVRVTASFTGGGLDKQPVIDADNAYTVNFKKHVTVRLNAVGGATIYYYVSDTDDAANNPAANAKWNVYAQPFTIARNCYIHA
ncbi:MAG: chitobiase/beta-hexosaminidase C-terminal domain-containing protein, partial [Paramuribaculum sp.]|nr:chitobiase/beta-hexosaminidase C-terminal domain-containing protein [Paramuribaculum sp.]